MSYISIGALVGVCLSAVLSVFLLMVTLVYRIDVSFSIAVVLGSIGLVGIVAGIIIFRSDRRNHRRLGLAGLGIALLYLGASVAPPLYLVTVKYYGPIAVLVVSLALLNIIKQRRSD